MRRYDGRDDKALSKGYVHLTRNDEVIQLFSVVRKGHSDILVPLGDLCEEHLPIDAAWTLEATTDPIDFKTLDSSGNHVSLEPIGEFKSEPPELFEKNIGQLLLAGGFLAISVRFSEASVDDDTDSIILVKDLLQHYSFAAKIVSKQMDHLLNLQNSYIFSIDIAEFEANTIALSESSPISFSPNNYLVKKTYSDNFDDILISVPSIVGPYRPDAKHPHYKMYMADFLSFYKKEDKPDAYLPISKSSEDKISIPQTSSKAAEDFKTKLDFEIAQNIDFQKSRHYSFVVRLKDMSRAELMEEVGFARNELKTEIDRVSGFAKKQKTQERKDASFRYLMACEAKFLLYGLKTDDTELSIIVG